MQDKKKHANKSIEMSTYSSYNGLLHSMTVQLARGTGGKIVINGG